MALIGEPITVKAAEFRRSEARTAADLSNIHSVFPMVKKGLDVCKKVDGLPSLRGVDDPSKALNRDMLRFQLFLEKLLSYSTDLNSSPPPYPLIKIFVITFEMIYPSSGYHYFENRCDKNSNRDETKTAVIERFFDREARFVWKSIRKLGENLKSSFVQRPTYSPAGSKM